MLHMCNINNHTYVHTQPHCQLSHSSVSTSQSSSASSQHLSYLLFTLQFISTYILKSFICFFLNKDRRVKSPVPWKTNYLNLFLAKSLFPRSSKKIPFTGFHMPKHIGFIIGLMHKNCNGLESSCCSRASRNSIFYSDVLYGRSP